MQEFLPWYSNVHRGAGYKSQLSTRAYEDARTTALAFAGRSPGGAADDTAITAATPPRRSTTSRTACDWPKGDVVTTVAEHHANLLPWSRAATCRYVECGTDGTFTVGDVAAALDQRPSPRLLASTGAANITGWMPPLAEIIAAAHDRGIPVAVDAAQLAPHRPLPAGADFLAWSGRKMYAPFGRARAPWRLFWRSCCGARLAVGQTGSHERHGAVTAPGSRVGQLARVSRTGMGLAGDG